MDAGAASVAGLLGGLVGVAGTLPYVRDMLRGSTVPHRGTWFVWSVIEAVAVVSHRADGGGWLLVPLAGQAAGTVAVFVLSVRRGVGGLTRTDLALIALAAVGILGWIRLDRPVVATACVVLADLVGMVLMVPKAWVAPESETVTTFAMASLGGALAAVSADALAPTLLLYPTYFCLANGVMATMLVRQRGTRGIQSVCAALLPPRDPTHLSGPDRLSPAVAERKE
jgi:hypothetical protein